jgi:hypothetical protein
MVTDATTQTQTAENLIAAQQPLNEETTEPSHIDLDSSPQEEPLTKAQKRRRR